MILFYSDSCQHCSVLLDTIKKHDTKKTIKLVCIDTIIDKIKHKITNVPALMFLPSKELTYGKAVFDYLLLPNRGYLFNNNTTREKTPMNTNNSSMNSPVPLNINTIPDEPMAFSLGSITADNFSDINDDNINSMNINNDRIYKWDVLDNTNVNTNTNANTNSNTNANTNSIPTNTRDLSSNKDLPSIEELTRQRENLFKDIK
jgi:hypothetical protein